LQRSLGVELKFGRVSDADIDRHLSELDEQGWTLQQYAPVPEPSRAVLQSIAMPLIRAMAERDELKATTGELRRSERGSGQ
jgi:hypothetical protein